MSDKKTYLNEYLNSFYADNILAELLKSNSLEDFHNNLDTNDKIKYGKSLNKEMIKTFSIEDLFQYIPKFYNNALRILLNVAPDYQHTISLPMFNKLLEFRDNKYYQEYHYNRIFSSLFMAQSDITQFLNTEEFKNKPVYYLRNIFSVNDKLDKTTFASVTISLRKKMIKDYFNQILSNNFNTILNAIENKNEVADFINFAFKHEFLSKNSYIKKINKQTNYETPDKGKIINELHHLYYSDKKLTEAQRVIFYFDKYPKNELKEILLEEYKNKEYSEMELNPHIIPYFIKNDLLPDIPVKYLPSNFNKISSKTKISLVSDLLTDEVKKDYTYSLIFNDSINPDINFLNLYKVDDFTKNKHFNPEKIKDFVFIQIQDFVKNEKFKETVDLNNLILFYNIIKSENIYSQEKINNKLMDIFIDINRFSYNSSYEDNLKKYCTFLNKFGEDFSLLKFKDYTKNFKHVSRQHNPVFISYLEQKVLNESVEEELPEMKKTVTKRL